ncbi:MAG TPA: phosphomannose isomerase type II C-terminal cupin domain [Burkholderiales bacterium]|nr:phosphomannose isomerase type II C-terminal cupin domain [Burkholderiales bacterium]
MADKDEAAFRARIVEDIRPWGKFRRYPHEDAGGIKIITVEPGGVLSLQYHDRRDEFWVVLDAGLEMTVADKVWKPAAGEEVFIPRKAPHRARNLGAAPARVMEIWIGRSDEADIVRLKDDYGRR